VFFVEEFYNFLYFNILDKVFSLKNFLKIRVNRVLICV
jgi:hypothetical protein